MKSISYKKKCRSIHLCRFCGD